MHKKNIYNFHIAFNSDDPRHIWAAEVLNKLGRRKATVIANALWSNAFGDVFANGASPVEKAQISQPSATPEANATLLPTRTTEEESMLAASINATLELFEDDDE